MAFTLEDLLLAHQRLKARIHGARLPIRTRGGRFAMGVVYFTTPILIGYGLMQWSNARRDVNLGPNREALSEYASWKTHAAGLKKSSSGEGGAKPPTVG